MKIEFDFEPMRRAFVSFWDASKRGFKAARKAVSGWFGSEEQTPIKPGADSPLPPSESPESPKSAYQEKAEETLKMLDAARAEKEEKPEEVITVVRLAVVQNKESTPKRTEAEISALAENLLEEFSKHRETRETEKQAEALELAQNQSDRMYLYYAIKNYSLTENNSNLEKGIEKLKTSGVYDQLLSKSQLATNDGKDAAQALKDINQLDKLLRYAKSPTVLEPAKKLLQLRITQHIEKMNKSSFLQVLKENIQPPRSEVKEFNQYGPSSKK
jgi:hypothetical protein